MSGSPMSFQVVAPAPIAGMSPPMAFVTAPGSPPMMSAATLPPPPSAAFSAHAQAVLAQQYQTHPSNTAMSITDVVRLANEGFPDDWVGRIEFEIRRGEKLFTDGNIPAARDYLFKLAQISPRSYANQKAKIWNLFIQISQQDPISAKTAHGVVGLTIDLVKILNRDLIQSETIEMQTLIVQAYAFSIELILRHFEKGTIGAVTEEHRNALLLTSENVDKLNAKKDPHLHVRIKMADEAARRVKGDLKTYLAIFKRLQSFGDALKCAWDKDLSGFLKNLVKTFDGLEKNIKKEWYDLLMKLLYATWGAERDRGQLVALQTILEKYENEDHSWKFKAAILGRLHQIARFGETDEIRRWAICGDTSIKTKGLIDFVTFASPKKEVQHCVRFFVIKSLYDIAENATDLAVRKDARIALTLALSSETDPVIRDFIVTNIPAEAQRKAWIASEDRPATQCAVAFMPNGYAVSPTFAAGPESKMAATLFLAGAASPGPVSKSSPDGKQLSPRQYEEVMARQRRDREIQEKERAYEEEERKRAALAAAAPAKTAPVIKPVVELLSERLRLKLDAKAVSSIGVNGEGKLIISKQGMAQLIAILRANPTVTTLDLTEICADNIDGLADLAAALPQTALRVVRLDCSISDPVAKTFASVIIALGGALKVEFGNSPNDWRYLADELDTLGRKDLAVDYYSAGIAKHPTHFETNRLYANRGVTLADLKQYDRAIADLREAIRINPTESKFYRNLASVLREYADAKRERGDLAGAVQFKEEALRVSQAAVEVNKRDAENYDGLGDSQLSLRLLLRSHFPNGRANPRVALLLDQAEASFRAALALEPQLASAQLGINMIAEARRNPS